MTRRIPLLLSVFAATTMAVILLELLARCSLVMKGLGDQLLEAGGASDGKIVFQFDGYIWTINANGSNLTKLPATTWEGPTVSPDGKRIAFVRDCPEGSSSPASASAASPDPDESFPCLYVMNADGSDQRTLLDGTGQITLVDVRPVWSPDGTEIAFVPDSR